MTAAETYLEHADLAYDPGVCLLWSTSRRPTYHTNLPVDRAVHEFRGSADYGLALLETGQPTRIARAHHVLRTIVAHQVTDPSDQHYGIWGYYHEEPPTQMRPADWNWADFIGARLAQILAQHGDALDGEVRQAVRDALRHAALAIFRRNVTRRYTNIAVLGAVVCAAAGELLELPFLVAYARVRLGNVRDLTGQTGGFEEYNSPTYTRVVVEELERAAAIVTDAEFREIAESIRRTAWQTLAERFHPATGQLAGPQSRAYTDWVDPHLADWLSRRVGARIAARQVDDAPPRPPAADLVPALPCPPELVDRFTKLPTDPLEVRTRFAVSSAHGETVGTTWLTTDACLGTVSQEHAWTQRRLLLGYWRTDDDPAVCLRARMVLNGQDLTAAWVRQAQDGAHVLAAWWLTYDSGHTHPHFDKPPGSVFDVDDLRARLVLCGRGVTGRQLDENRYELVAGDWKAVLHTAPSAFTDALARWRLTLADDEVSVDAVLYEGARRSVDFHTAGLQLGWGVELLHRSQEPSAAPVQLQHETDRLLHWHWGDLQVTVPAASTPFDTPIPER